MRPVPGVVLAAGLVLSAACGDGGPPPGMVADTTYLEDALTPGVILRRGPASPEEVASPAPSPVVSGDYGQISVYDGFFITAPCASAPRIDASRESGTIRVRVISEEAPADDACGESERAWAYAALIGEFEPGRYDVRVSHEGDLARSPLDTVYTDIAIEPRRR